MRRRHAPIFCASLALAGLVQAQVWKCEKDGQITYTNTGCGGGKLVEDRKLQGNVLDAYRAPATFDRPSQGQAAQDEPQDSECMSDQQIRNMETSGSSIGLGKKERQFIAAEVQRARNCQRGEGRYTARDQKVSRDAVAAQTEIRAKSRQQARDAAEAMHSTANPAEAQRIQATRAAEEARRAARQAAAAMQIASCDGTGCWTTGGQRVEFIPGSDRVRYAGQLCMVVGARIQCP